MRDTLIHLTGLVPDILPDVAYFVLLPLCIYGACIAWGNR